MGVSFDISNQKDNLSQIKINYKSYLPESFIDKLNNSIVKIIMNKDRIGTGFLMQLIINRKNHFYLVTSNHIIKRNDIEQKLNCFLFYGKKENEIKKIIKLDINERIIQNFENPINITLIEIIESDNVPKDKFLIPDYNYKNGYNIYLNKDICSAGYFLNGERYLFFGKILKIHNSKFQHSLDYKNSPVGAPICLSQNICIIGIINKEGKINNIGTFIGDLVDIFLEKEENLSGITSLSSRGIFNDTMVKEAQKQFNEVKQESNSDINLMDYILKKDCKPKEDYFEFFKFLQNEKRQDFFVNISIFNKSEYKKYKEEFLQKYKSHNLSELEKACIGSLLGGAIGDAIGSRVEFLPLNYNSNRIIDMGKESEGHFSLRPGQWTDNNSMTICIADSLIEKKEFVPKDIMMRLILWWKYGYNNGFRFDKLRTDKSSVGIGATVRESCEYYIKTKGKYAYATFGNPNASGNATLMRNAAIPILYFREEKRALEFSKKQSKITHQSEEAACCCKLLTYIIIKIKKKKKRNTPSKFNPKTKINIHSSVYLHKSSKNNIVEYSLKDILNDLKDFKCENSSVNCLAQSLQENKNRNWNWKNNNFQFDEKRAKENPNFIGSYCMDGLSMALHSLYTTNNFRDSILKVANLCADSGSIASIVGQIAGAYYGLDEVNSIPNEWIKEINKWDDNEIALRGYLLCNLNEGNINKL